MTDTITLDMPANVHADVRTYDPTTADLLLLACGSVPADVIEQIAAEAAEKRREHKLASLRELAAHEATIIG